jgi:ABC-2 type transport system permease protein
MFWHIFSNKIKIMLRNKAMMFWTCIFPIILATLFNLAFSNIAEMEKWGKINIAVVKLEENKDLETTINNFSQEDEYQIFNTRYVTEEEAITLLKNDEIAGYIKIGKEAEIVVKENSLEQTILKYIVDQYYQMSSVSKNSLEYNKDILSNGVLKVFTENQSYFKDTSNSNTDYTVNYFYSLIGMACLFGGFFGLFTANETEANLSIRGARINVAPVNKIKILIAGLLAGLLIQYTEIIVLLVYLIFILGIDFGNKIIYILLISFFGCLAGVVWGILIAVMTKTSETVKSLLLVIFTITCSFLSGMMTIDS